VIFLDRGRRKSDAYLSWKVRLFFAGAVVALLGMAVASSWVVGAGTLILLGAALLRFVPERRAGPPSEPPPEPPPPR
jgi:fatty acid desaturase